MGAGVVTVEGWDRFPWLMAGFSTRFGGVSSAYGSDELNLGWAPEDAEANVVENRQRFLDVVTGGREVELATVRQVHGAVVQSIEADHGELVTAQGRAVLQGDGVVTALPGVMLGVQTADCVPVLVVDTRLRVVAALHAGWRGTLAGIVGEGVGMMRGRYGSNAEDMVAAIGPSIGACCFAIGEEVRSEFLGRYEYGKELFSEMDGQLRMDLWEANRRQLVDAGVRAQAITVVGECSGCARGGDGRRKYFSHRIDKGVTGRMMSVVGIR